MELQTRQHHLKHVIAPHIEQILREFKQVIVDKYPLLEMRLFGSTARGDATRGSDIDIFIRLPEVNRVIEEDLFDMAYELELKYDCLIDVIILADSILKKHSEQLPIYQNILQESVVG